MAKIKGICKNIDADCSMAFNKTIQEAEKDEFVCSECGAPLKEVTAADTKAPGNDRRKIGIIIGAVVALGAIGGIGYNMGWFGGNDEPTEVAEPVKDGVDSTEVKPVAEPIDSVEEVPAVVEEPKEEVKEEPKVEQMAQSGTSTRNLGFGTYDPASGTITMTKDYVFETINGDVSASKGEKIVSAKVKNGRLISGQLIRNDGTRPIINMGAM